MPGAAQIPIAAMGGKNARLVIFSDDDKVLVDFKTWDWKPNITKHNDGINGDDSDELDFTFNYWEFSGELFNRKADMERAYLKTLAARQANTAPLVQAGGIRFYPNDGTRRSFVLVNLVWDDFNTKHAGRSERLMTSVSMRCRKITESKTL